MTTLPLFDANALTPPPNEHGTGLEWVKETPTDTTTIWFITLRDMPVGVPVTVNLKVELTPQGQGLISIPGHAYTTYSKATQGTFTETVTLNSPTLKIYFLSFHRVFIDLESANTSIIAAGNLPNAPLPGDVLQLQALLPLPGVNAFKFGQSRLNVDALGTPVIPKNVFVLNRDRLGVTMLRGPESYNAWQNILPPGRSLAINRGADADGPVWKAEVGTLEFHAAGQLDPRVTGMGLGTPLQAIHWPTSQRLFTGKVSALKVIPRKPRQRPAYDVQIQAADTVADLAAITRYGAKSETGNGSEVYAQFLQRIMKSAPNVEYQIGYQHLVNLGPTVWETSLAAYLDAAVASVGNNWYVDRENICHLSAHDTGIAFPLTDEQPTSPEDNEYSYTAIDTGWGSDTSITTLQVNNHGAQLEDDEWRADDTELEITDPTAAAYGNRSMSVDTVLADPEDARTYLGSKLRAAPLIPAPRTIEVQPCSPRVPAHIRGPFMAIATRLDPLTHSRVKYRGETAYMRVTRISHQITPTEWNTSLDLTQ